MLLDYFPPNARLRRTWAAWCVAEAVLADQAYHAAWEEGSPPGAHILQRIENATYRLNRASRQGESRNPTRPRGA